MKQDNPILDTDSYKLSHHLQYPPGMSAACGYIEARGLSTWPDVVFFGLQAFLKDMIARPVTASDIVEAEEIALLHGLPFNRAGWERIVSHHGGHLPVLIEALPEGAVVRRGVPMVQVTSTDPMLPWITAYLDTALTRAVWYPSTVASHVRRIHGTLFPLYEKTCDPEQLAFGTRLHDFGARSATSREQAALGGLAHLLFFERTDTLGALIKARNAYGAQMAGFSIPASEHATMTAWGQEGEAEAYRSMLHHFARYGAVSVVSDSYDIARAVSDLWGKALKTEVEASGAMLIVRSDSGDPVDMPVQVMTQLAYAFGTTLNSRGYRVINNRVRVMQGDGVTLADMVKILGRMEAFGFSADNIYFGMGSQLIQKVSRDTYSFTMKINAVADDQGRWHDAAKRPASMQEKGSKAGRQAVVTELFERAACRLDEIGPRQNHLQPVYRDGALLREWSLEEVRQETARMPFR